MKIKFIDQEIPANYTKISDNSQPSTIEYNRKKYTIFAVGEKEMKGKHRFWVGFRSLAKIIFSFGHCWRNNEKVRDDWIAARSGKRKVAFYKLDEIKPSSSSSAQTAQSVNTGSQKVFNPPPAPPSSVASAPEEDSIVVQDMFVEIPEFDIQHEVERLAIPTANLAKMKNEIAEKIAIHIYEHITLEFNPSNVKELMEILIGKGTDKLVERKFGKKEQQVTWNTDINKLVQDKLDGFLWKKVNEGEDLTLLKQVMRSPYLTEITKGWDQYIINESNAICSLAEQMSPENIESLKTQCQSLTAKIECYPSWLEKLPSPKEFEFKLRRIFTDKYVESIHRYHSCVRNGEEFKDAFAWTKTLENFVLLFSREFIDDIQKAVFSDEAISKELTGELFEKIYKAGDWNSEMAVYKAVASSILTLETYVKTEDEFSLQDFTGCYQTIVNELQKFQTSINASEDILLNRYMGVLRGLFQDIYVKSQEILQKIEVQVLSPEYRGFRKAYETCGELIGAHVKVELDMNTEYDALMLQQMQLADDEEAARLAQERYDAELAQRMAQDPNFNP